MADEVSVSLSLSVNSTNFTDSKNFDFTDTLASQFVAAGIQTITTAYAALTIGDMASTDTGLCLLHSLDVNNYILYGSTAGEFKLDPGEFAFVRINPGKTIQAMANTANVKVEKYLLGK